MTDSRSTSSNNETGGLQAMYRSRFAGQDAYREGIWRTLVKNYFQHFVGEGNAVLDLGAGYCQFINHVSCGKKYAIDLNPDTRFCAGEDVDVVTQDCTLPWPIEPGSLDVVFTSNFFEHLSDKDALGRVITEAYRALRPGGQLIAMGPNIKYLPGAYWDFLDHHIPLTEYSLGEALKQQGFEIERSIDKFLPFTMVGKPQYPTFFATLYLHLPFAWRIFGKQFLVIVRKPV